MKAVVATLLFIIALVKISRGDDGIVANLLNRQIEIEGELAHCRYKSKLKMEKINEIHSQIICNSIVIGFICGDKCLRYDSMTDMTGTCQCGENNFNWTEPFYCCTPPDVKCERQGLNEYDVNCTMGKKLPFNEKCQNRCTTALSRVAVTTNCNQAGNNCPVSDYSSKMCTNSVNIASIGDIENACYIGEVCPEAKNGPENSAMTSK